MNNSNALYEALIIEQQINYYILKESYENLENGNYLTEAEDSKLKKAGAWIKQRWDQFVEKVKKALEAIVHFFTVTLPKWFKGIVDKILKFLKIKKEPKTVDASKLSDDQKKKVQALAIRANRATGLIAANSTLSIAGPAPRLAIGMKSDEERAETKQIGNDTVKKAQVIKDQMLAKCKECLDSKSGANPEYRKVIQDIMNCINKNEQIFVKMASSSKNGVKGEICDLKLFDKAITQRGGDFETTQNQATRFAALMNNLTVGDDFDDFINGKDEFIKNYTTYEQRKKARAYVTIQDLQKSSKEVEFTKIGDIEDILAMTNKENDRFANEAKKIDASLKKALTSASTNNVINVPESAISGMSRITNLILTDITAIANDASSLMKYIANETARFVASCQPA